MEHGNSSSATVMSVMDRLRQPRHIENGRKEIIACAFGPGINMEFMVLRRGQTLTNGHPKGHLNGHVHGTKLGFQHSLPAEDVD